MKRSQESIFEIHDLNPQISPNAAPLQPEFSGENLEAPQYSFSNVATLCKTFQESNGFPELSHNSTKTPPNGTSKVSHFSSRMTSSNPLFSMNLGTNQKRSSCEADPEGRNKVKSRLLILFKKKQLLAIHVASSVGMFTIQCGFNTLTKLPALIVGELQN